MSIDIPIFCVVDYPINWNSIVYILELLLLLVDNSWQHELFTIDSGKDKQYKL